MSKCNKPIVFVLFLRLVAYSVRNFIWYVSVHNDHYCAHSSSLIFTVLAHIFLLLLLYIQSEIKRLLIFILLGATFLSAFYQFYCIDFKCANSTNFGRSATLHHTWDNCVLKKEHTIIVKYAWSWKKERGYCLCVLSLFSLQFVRIDCNLLNALLARLFTGCAS